MNLPKILHLAVVSVFALAGAERLLDGVGYVRFLGKPDAQSYGGEMAILEGILLLIVALGIFRYDRRARMMAIFFAGLDTAILAAAVFIMPGILARLVMAGWLALWVPVLIWLFSPGVRTRFLSGSGVSRFA